MKLPLAYYGDPVLRKKGAPILVITDEIGQLVRDMIDTMIDAKGIGLAAPQVHHSLALFITYFPAEGKEEEPIDPSKIRVFINPKITQYSKTMTCYSEGCLSIPKVYGDVVRPLHITITALDIHGKSFTEDFHDFDAHVVLHENDHINGVLFIDRLSAKERKALDSALRKIKKA